LGELSPALLSAFIAERSGTGLAKTTVREGCSVLRVFLRYAHREGAVRSELWKTVEGPQVYRLSDIPRSISWEDVGRVLATADRRAPGGKRPGPPACLTSGAATQVGSGPPWVPSPSVTKVGKPRAPGAAATMSIPAPR
jgi:hypothetical protein